MTPQPVPQKRQGAFDDRSAARPASVIKVAAEAGRSIPATAAAIAAAWALR
jgi:hypothetical protein